MKPGNKSPSERAARRGHIVEFWSRRPLAGWPKTAANKVIARRLERHRLKRMVEQEKPHE